MHADHHLLFRSEQQARAVRRGERPVDTPRHATHLRERAGDQLIEIGLRLRGRPPDPWPRPIRG